MHVFMLTVGEAAIFSPQRHLAGNSQYWPLFMQTCTFIYLKHFLQTYNLIHLQYCIQWSEN